MSINKQYGHFVLVCDVCQESASCESFAEFDGAVKYKKIMGWKSQRTNGQWEDVCPDCQEAE